MIRRILRMAPVAAAGASAGMLLHRAITGTPTPDPENELVVAAPPMAIVAGMLLGVLSGRRWLAFLSGLGAAAASGGAVVASRPRATA